MMSWISKPSINKSQDRKNLLFVLGGPCTGKTTLCKLIAKKHNFDYFTSDQFSHLVKPKGIQVNENPLLSKLQSENVLKAIKTQSEKESILLEGFSWVVGNDFVAWRKEHRGILHIVGALYLHCPEETMKYRFFHRDKFRIDDLDKVVKIVNSFKCNSFIDGLEMDKKLMYIETNSSIENTLFIIEKELKDHAII